MGFKKKIHQKYEYVNVASKALDVRALKFTFNRSNNNKIDKGKSSAIDAQEA